MCGRTVYGGIAGLGGTRENGVGVFQKWDMHVSLGRKSREGRDSRGKAVCRRKVGRQQKPPDSKGEPGAVFFRPTPLETMVSNFMNKSC